MGNATETYSKPYTRSGKAPDAPASDPLREAMSEGTLKTFAHYLSEDGPAGFRHKKLAELIKALGWMSVPDLRKTSLAPLFNQLNTDSKGAFLNDLKGFAQRQQELKYAQADKRKAYQLKIIYHYRSTLNAGDKALLEALRDYELDRTGHDLNWQHYFRLNSLKKIDVFATSNAAERAEQIRLFKADVAAYTKNAERWQANPTDHGLGDHLFDFDDWCDYVSEQESTRDSASGQQNRQQKQAHTGSSSFHHTVQGGLAAAWRVMQLAPDSDFSALKRQFRALTLQHHPDVPTGNVETMKQILLAYDQLKQALSP